MLSLDKYTLIEFNYHNLGNVTCPPKGEAVHVNIHRNILPKIFYSSNCVHRHVNIVLSTNKVKRKREKNTVPEESTKKEKEREREAESDTIVALLSLYIELGRMQELASNGKLP